VNELFILLGIESWKPILTALLLPPVPLILLMLLGTRLVLPSRGLGWTVVLLAALLMWMSTTLGTSRLLAQQVLRPPPALTAQRLAEIKAEVQAKRPVAIVVLGGGLHALSPEYGVSNLTDQSLERLRYGVWLGRETGAPIGFSGGQGWAQQGVGTPEAQIAQRIAAQEFGRPLKWIEDASRDTHENAQRSMALLRAQGVERVLLVTHDWHMRRALREFKLAAPPGMEIEAAPLGVITQRQTEPLTWLPTAQGFESVRQVLRELLAGAI
jgi:uncharacterized SAM-binding protein YcdF (DUF218 family)